MMLYMYMYVQVHIIFSQVLYLMDQYNVSDKFYHELSMVQPTIPRSHLIKRVRQELNHSLKTMMFRVPGPHHGVYCSLTERLREELEVIVSTAAYDLQNGICLSSSDSAQPRFPS